MRPWASWAAAGAVVALLAEEVAAVVVVVPAAGESLPRPESKAASAGARRTSRALFDAARSSAAQRATTSLAAADSMSKVANAANDHLQRIDGRTFALRDSVWTDARYSSALRTVTIKPYSKAWFDLVARLPELKAPFAIGDRVIVAGRAVAISVAPSGVESLSAHDLDDLIANW